MHKQHARQGLEVGENTQKPILAHTGLDHQWLAIAQNTMLPLLPHFGEAAHMLSYFKHLKF